MLKNAAAAAAAAAKAAAKKAAATPASTATGPTAATTATTAPAIAGGSASTTAAPSPASSSPIEKSKDDKQSAGSLQVSASNRDGTATSSATGSAGGGGGSGGSSSGGMGVEWREEEFLCCLNLVRTKMDASVRRGAIVKAMAVCTRHRSVAAFKPVIIRALDAYFAEQKVDVLQHLYNVLNATALPIPALTPVQSSQDTHTHRTLTLSIAPPFIPCAHSYLTLLIGLMSASRLRLLSSLDSTKLFINTAIQWGKSTIAVSVPATLERDELAEYASLTTLVNTFKESTTKIFTALMTQKRVLFSGYQQPAAEVCGYVGAACLMVSPPLIGTLRRAFPYSNLTNLDFLTTYDTPHTYPHTHTSQDIRSLSVVHASRPVQSGFHCGCNESTV